MNKFLQSLTFWKTFGLVMGVGTAFALMLGILVSIAERIRRVRGLKDFDASYIGSPDNPESTSLHKERPTTEQKTPSSSQQLGAVCQNPRRQFEKRSSRALRGRVILFCVVMAIELVCVDTQRWWPGGWRFSPVERIVLALVVFVPFIWIAFSTYESRRIGIDCDNCGKYIAGRKPWVCGYCDTVNKSSENTSPTHSFLQDCGECGKAPKGLQCPHCGHAIRLGTWELDRNIAWIEGDVVPTQRAAFHTEQGLAAAKRVEEQIRGSESEKIRYETAKRQELKGLFEADTALRRTVKDNEREVREQKALSENPLDRKIDELMRAVSNSVGNRLAADKVLALFRNDLKNDTVTLALVERTINDWLQDHS